MTSRNRHERSALTTQSSTASRPLTVAMQMRATDTPRPDPLSHASTTTRTTTTTLNSDPASHRRPRATRDRPRMVRRGRRRFWIYLVPTIVVLGGTLTLAGVLVWMLQDSHTNSSNSNSNNAKDTTTAATHRLSSPWAALRTSKDAILRQSHETEKNNPNQQRRGPTAKALSQPTSPLSLSPDAIAMCTSTLWHTLESTTIVLPHDETFVHTGDIDDLWLRDSAAQVHPLLLPVFPRNKDDPTKDHGTARTTTNDQRQDARVALIYNDPRLDRVVAGLIARHALYIRHDPYANAFRIDDSYVFSDAQKKMGRHDLISTWNYELDSGCYTLRLLYHYWKATARDASSTVLTTNTAVKEAVSILIDLWTAEQRHEDDVYPTGPWFDCVNCQRPYRYPGLARNGKGTPTNPASGLTWTGFRPSDDECLYGYLIPANLMAVAALGYAAELATQVWQDPVLADQARTLAARLYEGVQTHGIVEHEKYGRIYAYEVDGLGNANLMDDANVPSLLSIPYLDCPYDPEVYANTRRFVLSQDNPWYATTAKSSTSHDSTTTHDTAAVSGIGSPHMKARIPHNVWPMAMAMEALTMTDDNDNTDYKTSTVERQRRMVEQLVHVSAGTNWMHESFDVNHPHTFTRSWFCWADALYAELALVVLNATIATTTKNGSDGGATEADLADGRLTMPCPDRGYDILEWRDPVTVPGGIYAAG